MTPEQWLKIKEEFALLAGASPSDRQIRLQLLDESTRRQVQQLLSDHDDASSGGTLFDRPLLSSSSLLQWLGEEQTFDPGEVLLDRFEVVRLIGRGGMGEVYEALDKLAPQAVAIKTIRSDLASQPEVIRRFRVEVQRARQVSHVNVCRVGDLFSIERGDGHEVLFFTMDLLAGETLEDCIRRAGPLDSAAGLTIAGQVCAGLQAAHDCGILHRDLKCPNIILAAEAGRTEAKLTDFGLAREMPSDGDSVITGGENLPGTLAYMAPELLEGRAASKESDIYALGVVLYRMISGRYPFEAETDLVSAAMRLRTRPPSPRRYVPAISASWERTVLACLAGDPRLRPSSARLVAELLEGRHAAWWSQRKHVAQGYLGRRSVLVGGAASVAAAGIAAIAVRWGAPPFRGRRVSVFVEELESGDPGGSLGRAVRSMVKLAWANVPDLSVLQPARVAQAAKELSLGTQPMRGDIALRIARQVRADVVIGGRLESLANSFLLRLEAIAAGSGKSYLKVQSNLGDQLSLPAGVESACAEIYRGLTGGILANARTARSPVEPVNPSRPDALEMFTAGLEYYQYGEINMALQYLRNATAIDPNFAMAYVYQTLVHGALRHEEQAFRAASRAFSLRGSVNERQRLQTEATYYYACGDIDQSIESQKILVDKFPAEAPLHRTLAQICARANRVEDAVQHARLAAKLESRSAINYMILASTLAQAERFSEAHQVLNDGRRQSPGSPVLLSSEATLGILEGKPAEALAALAVLERRNDYAPHARSHRIRCYLVYGQSADARAALETEIGLASGEGDVAQEDLARHWLGQLLFLQGHREGAARQAATLALRAAEPYSLFALRSAVEIAHESGARTVVHSVGEKLRRIQAAYPSRYSSGLLLQAEGLYAASLGNIAEAGETLARAANSWNDVSNHWSLAQIFFSGGTFERALTLYESMIARKGVAIRWEQQTQWVRCYAQAARCCRKLGRHKPARIYYEAFLRHWGTATELPLVRDIRDELNGLA